MHLLHLSTKFYYCPRAVPSYLAVDFAWLIKIMHTNYVWKTLRCSSSRHLQMQMESELFITDSFYTIVIKDYSVPKIDPICCLVVEVTHIYIYYNSNNTPMTTVIIINNFILLPSVYRLNFRLRYLKTVCNTSNEHIWKYVVFSRKEISSSFVNILISYFITGFKRQY